MARKNPQRMMDKAKRQRRKTEQLRKVEARERRARLEAERKAGGKKK
jgi:hypothetical protein